MAKTPPTRSEEVLRRLEQAIFQGRLAPGTHLDEQELAQRFAVSRTPVREALRHLASSGLVELRRHHGAVVKTLTIAELVEMFQVMAELEGLCARLAARRMTPDERAALRAGHERCLALVAGGDREGFFAANNALHEIIYAGSHNGFLATETRELRNRVNPYRYAITFQPRRMHNSNVEHEAVIRAIETHDAEEAHRLMREHVNLLGESAADVLAVLRLDAGGPGGAQAETAP